jgi:hypothetical protein
MLLVEGKLARFILLATVITIKNYDRFIAQATGLSSHFVSGEEKYSFKASTPGVNVIKLFSFVTDAEAK